MKGCDLTNELIKLTDQIWLYSVAAAGNGRTHISELLHILTIPKTNCNIDCAF